MHFRAANEADIRILAQLRWDFHCEGSLNPPLEPQDQFMRNCEAFLRDGLAGGAWTCWIAEDDTIIVAHIFVHLFHPIPRPDRPIDNYGYMTNVYTKPAYRNRRVGAMLMQRVIAWARARDVAFLMVSPSERSIPFYRRAGFADQTEWFQLTLRS